MAPEHPEPRPAPEHPPQEIFANPFWHALRTEQASIAIGSREARRYPADVIPFAALAEPTPNAMSELRELLTPGESIYITGDQLPEVPGLQRHGSIPGWGMHPTETSPAEPPSNIPPVETLQAIHASEMVALTDAAFPGFFRTRTYTLGAYLGIRIDGALVAMAGERIALPGYREISAVCTHPDHVGKGYAAHLIRHMLRFHTAAGLRSFLHVAAANERAIGLYERLGFTKTTKITFNPLSRL